MKPNFTSIEPLEARIAPAVIIVNTLDDSTGVPGKTSLRDALALADSPSHPGPDTITFNLPAPPLHGENIITLVSGGLTSGGDVTIKGPGAGKLIIDGGGDYQIFNFNDGSGSTDSPVTISGLSLIHGNASGASSLGNGGAIYSAESLTLKNCVISGNSAKGSGGAVYAVPKDTANTAVNVLNCLISGNTANSAGFTANDGGGMDVGATKTVLISGCTITGNTNTGYNGGVFAAIISNSGSGTGMTISNDLIAGNSAAYGGGGLAVLDANTTLTSKGAAVSKITISSSTITGNSVTGTGTSGASGTAKGGGIYCYYGNVVLSNVTISNNTAVGAGGGIEASAATSLSITGGSIDGNSVSKGTGGGIDLSSGNTPLIVKGAHITGNHSTGDGGGIYLKTSGAVQIASSIINSNGVDKPNAGGGLASQGTGALNIIGTQFSFNTQDGIFVYNGTDVTIKSANITGNTAVGVGGGAYISAGGAINVISTSISGNQATGDGGGASFGGSGMLTLKSGTFAGNASGTDGGGMSIGPSLTGAITSTKITGNASAGKGGGIYLLNIGNAVTLGSGEASLISGNTAPNGPNTYGTAAPSGPAPHAGHGTFVVNTVADSTDLPGSGTVSLRDALALADAAQTAHPGVVETIAFALPANDFVNGAWTIQLGGTELASKGNVKIVGPGAGQLIIDGNNNSRVFDFSDGTRSADSPVSISGLSIIRGNGTGANSSGNGGGIYSAESLTLKNVVISGNVTASGYSGGGAYILGDEVAGTKVSISNSLVTGNGADSFAGGLWLSNLKSLTIDKTVVSGNTATLGTAGGIYASLSTAGTSMAITGCAISGNTGYGGGGLIVRDYNPSPTSKITISGTKITGNTATGQNLAGSGGGLYVSKGSRTFITGSTIQNNTAVYLGGGIFAADNFATLTISKSDISGNRTTATNASGQGGGGLYSNGSGTVKISNSTLADNRSLSNGGGVLASGNTALIVTSCVITGNAAAMYGGGIEAHSLNVTGSTIAGNTAMYGGGIHATDAITISTSKITGNVATVAGGGLYLDDPSGTATLQKDVVSSNSAVTGGGLFLVNSTAFAISGGSFTGNTAVSGGGLAFETATGSILGVSITGNTAGNGGGIVNLSSAPNAITVQIGKVVANSADPGPDVSDDPGDLSTYKFV